MKRLLPVLLFCMSLAATHAQDKIITIQKDTIECRIISVGAERISYEQKIAENYVAGKSIAIADVLQYFRSQHSDAVQGIVGLKVSRPKPERRYLLTIQGGLAHSFTEFAESKNYMTSIGISVSEADDYIGKLKNGYHLNAGFHYLLTNFLGVGADYSFFYSASEGEFLISGYGGMNLPVFAQMDLNEKVFTHFAGPSVLFQQFPGKERKLKISETLSPGIVMFRGESRGIEYQMYWGEDGYYYGEPPQYYDQANSVTKSTAFGVKGGLSVEYFVAPQLSAGLTGSFLWAKLQRISMKSLDYDVEDQKLENAISVSRIDYGFSVRYSF